MKKLSCSGGGGSYMKTEMTEAEKTTSVFSPGSPAVSTVTYIWLPDTVVLKRLKGLSSAFHFFSFFFKWLRMLENNSSSTCLTDPSGS